VETQTQNLLAVKEVIYHQTSSWVKKHVTILKFEGADAFKVKNINMHMFFKF
jgi:hypothetical protein